MIIIESMNKSRKIELTEQEIQLIIDELERVPHNIFEFLNYKKLINKLKNDKPRYRINYNKIKKEEN